MPYIYNIPYYSRNLYPNNHRNYNYYNKNNRYGFGGFAVPFALGFLTGPLVVRPKYYPYPPYQPYPNYPNYPYNYYYN